MSSLKNKIWGVGLVIVGFLAFSFLTTSKCDGSGCWIQSAMGLVLGFVFIAGGLIIYATPSKEELTNEQAQHK
ncbi:MAG: hypothetical protein ACP5IG_00625 [Candidatus Micrarchaeia archaeon]